jgi:prepilin-type N-terminal cleavage/methylation domain-containing protein
MIGAMDRGIRTRREATRRSCFASRMSARRGERGFTLIEILVASTLLVVGMTGILALFTTALALEAEAEERTDVALALPEALREVESEVGAAAYGIKKPADPKAGDPARKKAGLGGEFDLAMAGGAYRCRWSTEAAADGSDARAVFVHLRIVVGAGTDDEKVYDFGRLPIAPEAPPPGSGR